MLIASALQIEMVYRIIKYTSVKNDLDVRCDLEGIYKSDHTAVMLILVLKDQI